MIKTKTILSISRILSHFLLTNLAFGFTNIVIFNNFWVDGWAYPSLFISVNITIVLAFYLFRFYLINPSFNIKKIFFICLKNCLFTSFLITSYWLIIDSNRYYLVHLLLFLSLNFIFIIMGNLLLNNFIKIIAFSIFFERNIAIIYENDQFSKFKKIIKKNKWLNYTIVLESNINDIDNLSIYIESLNIKEIFIFSESLDFIYNIKQISSLFNIKNRIIINKQNLFSKAKLIIENFHFE